MDLSAPEFNVVIFVVCPSLVFCLLTKFTQLLQSIVALLSEFS